MKFIPDFFIAGYPKCGTTALYNYLRDRPDVYLPDIKEPHFFSHDLPGIREASSFDQYASLYLDRRLNQVAGDASASTIHSNCAIENIVAERPDAKFIVIVREPVSALISYHSELLYNLTEDEHDLEQAWRLQDLRKQGCAIATECRESKMLHYGERFRYRDQLPRFFDSVRPENRMLMVFDEFFANPLSEYKSIVGFLGLSYDGRTNFPSVNASKSLRFEWLSRLHRRVVNNNGKIYRSTKNLLNLFGVYPSHTLSALNVKPSEKQEVSPEFENELRDYFRADVDAVELALGRKLESWRK